MSIKRSRVVELIANWGKDEILNDVYCKNYEEWADNLLHVLESEVGMLPPALETYEISRLNGESLGQLGDVYEWEEE